MTHDRSTENFPATPRLSRRSALALGLSAAAAPLLGRTALAKSPTPTSFVYNLQPMTVADGVWAIMGANDKITPQNGGAIANIVILDTKDGAVVVDTGPSHRYGVELEAAARQLTGKPVVRVFITHIHSDHSLGATAFEQNALYAADGLAADLKLRGNDITNAMYRATGDWMRGTNVPEPKHVASNGVEDVGERRFRCLNLKGHTLNDLCLFEERSGLLLTGDLVFLDRAPTTPDADIPAWRTSLATLADIPHAQLVPGHGPIEPGRRGIDQTRRWLDFVDSAVATHFNQGLDVTEMMATDMPDWTNEIAVGRYEYQRSIMHLLPRLEATRLPIVT